MIVEISMILLMETYYKSSATDNSEGKTVIITIERSGSVVECNDPSIGIPHPMW